MVGLGLLRAAATTPRYLRCRCQRTTDQFLVVSCKDVTIGVGRRGPNDIPAVKRMGCIEQMNATEFLITLETKSGVDQISLVGEEQDRIFIGSEVDAAAVFQGCHSICRPDLMAGRRLEANQFADRLEKINQAPSLFSTCPWAQGGIGRDALYAASRTARGVLDRPRARHLAFEETGRSLHLRERRFYPLALAWEIHVCHWWC